MWTKTSVDASNATASQIYSPEEAQEILAMQDKALMRNPKEYELTDAEWNRIPLNYATLVASHEFRDEETNKNYIDQLFQLNDKYYHSATDTEWNLEIYKELNRDAASPILAAEINRDESVQASAIMRDGYEEIEVPLSLDDNTIAEIKDAVKENVEQSLDVSVQHFFETAEPNHNYSQEEVHALAETVGKFVTAYQEYQEPEKEFSLEKNIQRIEEGLTSPEILPRLTAELDKAIDVSQRATSEGIFLLPDRIVEQAVEVAQQMEMYTKPLEFEKSEIVQFDSEVIMDTETADGETKATINLALYMTDDFMEQALDRAGAFELGNPSYQAENFETLMYDEDGAVKTAVNGYIDINQDKEVSFTLYTSDDVELTVPLSDTEQRIVLDEADKYIQKENGVTLDQNLDEAIKESRELSEIDEPEI